MKKLSASERQDEIINLLSKNGAMKTLDLANYFHVSRETMRRDLLVLTEQGRIDKWFGGVICSNQLAQHSAIYEDVKKLLGVDTLEQKQKEDFRIRAVEEKMEMHVSEKMQICSKALELILPCSTIYLDNGTTTLYLAKLLSQKSGYTIITTSIPIANICMNSANQLIICGGSVDPRIASSTGASAVDFLSQLKTDAAVFGSEGFLSSTGPTGNDLDYSKVKKAALQNTQTSIVLADSSKATYSSMIQYAEWKDINYLVTDSGISSDFINRFSKSTNIITVNV